MNESKKRVSCIPQSTKFKASEKNKDTKSDKCLRETSVNIAQPSVETNNEQVKTEAVTDNDCAPKATAGVKERRVILSKETAAANLAQERENRIRERENRIKERQAAAAETKKTNVVAAAKARKEHDAVSSQTNSNKQQVPVAKANVASELVSTKKMVEDLIRDNASKDDQLKSLEAAYDQLQKLSNRYRDTLEKVGYDAVTLQTITKKLDDESHTSRESVLSAKDFEKNLVEAQDECRKMLQELEEPFGLDTTQSLLHEKL